jgi:hypothetical protein
MAENSSRLLAIVETQESIRVGDPAYEGIDLNPCELTGLNSCSTVRTAESVAWLLCAETAAEVGPGQARLWQQRHLNENGDCPAEYALITFNIIRME